MWGPCSVTPASRDSCATGNDDNCNGIANEGCPCAEGQTRPCSQGGLIGKCANGTQTCNAQGQWGACSITPSVQDSCVLGNNDDCTGAPNQGCLCIENVTTRNCGVCADGSQACTNGRTGQYGTCTGGTQMRTYYRDADADGHGSAESRTVCGSTPPAGFIAGPADDCYDSNKDAFPGQTAYFYVHRGDGSFDYNCNGTPERLHPAGSAVGVSGCTGSCTSSSPCNSAGPGRAPDVTCGQTFGMTVGCACMPTNCGGVGTGIQQTCR
jgi:hypothetical protein